MCIRDRPREWFINLKQETLREVSVHQGALRDTIEWIKIAKYPHFALTLQSLSELDVILYGRKFCVDGRAPVGYTLIISSNLYLEYFEKVAFNMPDMCGWCGLTWSMPRATN